MASRHVGATLGPYRIIQQIGIGGMATVYKAFQPGMERYVALKILPDHYARDPKFVKRFIQEVRIIAKLEHKNILPVHDFGEENGVTYLAMRYLEAGSLKDVMDEGRLSLTDTADIVGQVCSALDHAHRQGIVHRDVKPANILVDQDGEAYLTDFGIAKVLAGTSDLTGTGAAIGTPAYMAPEQSMGKKVDGRADIYALGIMLYEMVVGQVPYQAETPMAVVLAHIHNPLPLPHEIDPSVPEPVEAVILKALAKNPDDRYQTASQLAAALDEAIIQSNVDASHSRLRVLASQARHSRIQEMDTFDVVPADSFAPVANPVAPRRGCILIAGALALLALVLVVGGGFLAIVVLRGGLAGEEAEATAERDEASPAEEPVAQTDEEPVAPTEAPAPIAVETTIPLGFPGNQVTTNDQWTPQIETINGVEMVLVPVGCFMMGSDSGFDDNKPAHEQCFDEPFWVDMMLVTTAQYATYLNNQLQADLLTDLGLWFDVAATETYVERTSDLTWHVVSGFEKYPITGVSWYGARAHCEAQDGRLLTEAEWAFAARGPDALVYPWGNSFNGGFLNYCDVNCVSVFANDPAVDDGWAKTSPVDDFPLGRSWVGAFDMTGNVWEWMHTILLDYPYDATDGREDDTDTRSTRVVRGSSWDNPAGNMFLANHYMLSPSSMLSTLVGFRCASDF